MCCLEKQSLWQPVRPSIRNKLSVEFKGGKDTLHSPSGPPTAFTNAPKMQDPILSFPGPLLKIVFAAINFEG